jgi:pimeloyl-ACP methyl ester carboxylesterase
VNGRFDRVNQIRTRTVRSTDGLDLAVYEQGPEGAETIVLVHGYPDNHTVWDGVAELLAPDFHVVRYDVRGHGASDVPATTSGYALPLLSRDLRAVIEATSPDAPVHLVAHDWGSIQSWESVLDPAFGPLLRSYVSISGPSLDAAGVWLRRGLRHPRATLKQLAASYYVFAFQLPFLPEAAARSGVLDKAVNHSANIGVTDPAHRTRERRPEHDLVNGIELYRANFVPRMLRPRLRTSSVATLVLAPRQDAHVTVELQTQAPAPYLTDYRFEEIDGNHWVIAQQPAFITGKIVDFLSALGR